MALMTSTADLSDEFRDEIRTVNPGLVSYGSTSSFSGPIDTVRVDEDNTLVSETLSTPGDGRVLVVDGGGKTVALVGDRLATIAIESGWVGIVVNGYVRDTETLRSLSIGVLALGTCPRRSFETRSAERSIAVTFLGATFRPGEWLYADSDGVVISSVERFLGQ